MSAPVAYILFSIRLEYFRYQINQIIEAIQYRTNRGTATNAGKSLRGHLKWRLSGRDSALENAIFSFIAAWPLPTTNVMSKNHENAGTWGAVTPDSQQTTTLSPSTLFHQSSTFFNDTLFCSQSTPHTSQARCRSEQIRMRVTAIRPCQVPAKMVHFRYPSS